MKSFSNFLLEKKPLDITNDPKGGEKFLKNLRKKSVQNQTDVKTVDRPADVQGRMDATDTKKGGYSRVDDTFDSNKSSGKRKLSNTTKGGEVRTIRPPDSPSGNESRPLGKLNKRTGKLNFSANKELQAKRKLRVDTTTGKATPKGVENYAQGRGGYGRTTGKPRNMPKAEWESRKAQAKQIASNPGSKAYKEIENKINTSDYAGKRAKGASPTELKSVKSSIANSKTIDAKVDTGRGSKAPTNIKTKTTKIALNTSTRKGKIVKPTVTPTKVVKQSEVSKKAAEFTKKTNQLKVSKAKVPTVSSLRGITNSSKTSKTPAFDGRRFNNPFVNKKTKVPSSGPYRSTTSNPQGMPKDILKQIDDAGWTKKGSGVTEPRPGSSFPSRSKVTSVTDLGRATDTRFSVNPKPTVPPKPRGSGLKMGSGAKSYKQFMQSAAPGKTLTKNLSKTLRPSGKVAGALKGTANVGGKVLSKAAAPLTFALDTASGYNKYRDKGHGKIGSFVRGAIKGAASTAGFVAGGTLGAIGGGGLASAATGTAGALAGGALAGKTADWAIKAFDTTFGGVKKRLDPKYKRKVIPSQSKDTKIPKADSFSPGTGWKAIKDTKKTINKSTTLQTRST